MAELISRQEVCEVLAHFAPENYTQLVEMLVVKLPAVDAVEVVRCRDCKHISHLQGAKDEAYVCALGWGLRGIVAEEDFCSYGKRREENAD